MSAGASGRETTMIKNTDANVGMNMVVSTAIGLIVLAAVFSLAPVIGYNIDEAVDLDRGVAASGTLTYTGNSADGESVTIGGRILEFDTNGAHNPHHIPVVIGDTGAATAVAELAAAINGNASLAAIVDATHDSTTCAVTADEVGEAGNSITTVCACVNASWGAGTLTGGSDSGGSVWVDEDVPTGVDLWADNASLLSLTVLVIIIGLVIFGIRNMGRR